MGEKKVVSRTVAIALGIICIILAGLVGAIADYAKEVISGKDSAISSLSSQITTKDSQMQALASQNSQLQAWLDGNETLLNQTQRWLNGNVTDYETRISSLNAQITQLQTWLEGNITAYNSLQSNYAAYMSNHPYTDSEIDSVFLNFILRNSSISTFHADFVPAVGSITAGTDYVDFDRLILVEKVINPTQEITLVFHYGTCYPIIEIKASGLTKVQFNILDVYQHYFLDDYLNDVKMTSFTGFKIQTDKPMVLNITGLARIPTNVVESPTLLMQTCTPINWTWVSTNNGVIMSIPPLTDWIILQ
jgi:hypothetical protein